MTTLHPPSKLPPRCECFAVFVGTRHIRNALYEHIAEAVQVVEVWRKGNRELGVKMTGRQQAFQLAAFVGIWQTIELEETP